MDIALNTGSLRWPWFSKTICAYLPLLKIWTGMDLSPKESVKSRQFDHLSLRTYGNPRSLALLINGLHTKLLQLNSRAARKHSLLQIFLVAGSLLQPLLTKLGGWCIPQNTYPFKNSFHRHWDILKSCCKLFALKHLEKWRNAPSINIGAVCSRLSRHLSKHAEKEMAFEGRFEKGKA